MAIGDRSQRRLWILLLALLPFGEGGAMPGALLVIHSLVLLLCGIGITRADWTSPDILPAGLRSPTILFLVVLLIASLGSSYRYASFLRAWDLVVVVLAFAAARGTEWGGGGERLLFDGLLASAGLQALGVAAATLSGRAPEFLARFGLLNGDHEAAYLNLAILSAGAWLVSEGERGGRARGLLLVLCLLGVSLLASRGALLGLAAGALLMIPARWRGLSRRGRVIGGALLMLGGLGASAGVWNRFASSQDPFRYGRVGIWKAGLNCLAGHPLLGVGPGMYRHLAHRFNFPIEGPVRYGRIFTSAHSDYLGLLIETGLCGGVAGLFILGKTSSLLHQRQSRGGGPALGALCGLTALAVQAMVDDLSQRPALALSMAIIAGASLRRRAEDGAPHADGGKAAVPGRMAFALAPLGLIWIVTVLNPYLAFRSEQAMHRSRSLAAMERSFARAVRFNPYQADTYRFPASAFLSAHPEPSLTPDLYARFRRDLDEGIRQDSTSADLQITRARLEARGFRRLFHDASSRDRAIASYRAGIRLAPHDPRPRLELGDFLRQVGRRSEALEQASKALEVEPSFLSARVFKAQLLLEAGAVEPARQEWRIASEFRKNLATVRPESPYAADLRRWPDQLAGALERRLQPL